MNNNKNNDNKQETSKRKRSLSDMFDEIRSLPADTPKTSIYENVDLHALQYEQRFYDDIHELFLKRMREDEAFCVNIWSALANVKWHHNSDDRNTDIGYSFRSAGSLIAEMLCHGCYMDWYCSGPGGVVSDEIATAMASKGWRYEFYD